MVPRSAEPVSIPDTDISCGGGAFTATLKPALLFAVAEVTPTREDACAAAARGSVKGAGHLVGVEAAPEGPTQVVTGRHAVLDGGRPEARLATSCPAPLARQAVGVRRALRVPLGLLTP